jgi:pimeloyl-ACP methyl ester carboxylesterase
VKQKSWKDSQLLESQGNKRYNHKAKEFFEASMRKLLGTIGKAFLGFLGVLALGSLLVIGYILITRPSTPQFKGWDGQTVPESIAVLQSVELGGSPQWLLIRGRDISNPVLLFLHGGPGMPAMYLAHAFQRELEDDFVVVHWDRRGAGKSYSKAVPTSSLTDAQLLADALELVIYLKTRFEVDRVYLVGHSWGSRLGMLLVKKAPQHFAAYVGLGQLAFTSEIPAIQDRFIREEARKAGNRKALRELALKGRSVYEKWVFKFGGELSRSTGYWPLLWTGLRAPEYTLSDILNIRKGIRLYNEFFRSVESQGDLADEILSVRVPVYFFAGRHDYCTPFELTQRYFAKLRAPLKKMVWFEHSAHFPFFEEPQKFAAEMLKVHDETAAARR